MDFMQAWGQLRDLEAWLLQDQQTQVSRERTVSSCSSSFSIEKIDESEFMISPEEEEEDEDKMSDWLITPSPVPMDTVSDAERWRRVLKPFEDTWSSNEWLVESSSPAQDCSSCCQTTKAVEIENLGQLKCLKTPPPSAPTTPAASPAALEAWLQQVAPLQQTCKANEVCSTYSACVCDENCGKEALSLWLLRQDGRDKNGVPVTKNASPAAKNAPSNASSTTPKNAPPTTPKNVSLTSAKSSSPPLNLREKEQKVTAAAGGVDVSSQRPSAHMFYINHFNSSTELMNHSLFLLGSGHPGSLAPPRQHLLLLQASSTSSHLLPLWLGGSSRGESQQGGTQFRVQVLHVFDSVPAPPGSRSLGSSSPVSTCSGIRNSPRATSRGGGQVAAEEEESGSGNRTAKTRAEQL